ncbi:MAG: pyruvate kinase [Anaerolineae bacterium]
MMLIDSIDLSDARTLLETLKRLRTEVYEEGQSTFALWRPLITRRDFLISALNLAYYLALRRRDLRPVQAALIPWGLSSLGRLESRVLPNLDAVIATLSAVVHDGTPALHPPLRSFFRGERLLRHHTEAVFGKPLVNRRVRIMVTLPTEAAEDYAIVRDLIARGMDCARINCAHDDERAWKLMIDFVHRAAKEVGRDCKIAMDLGGPKSRTTETISKGRIYKGDALLLTRGTPKPSEEFRFQTRCTLTEALDQVRVGESVWIDDGKIGMKVEAAVPEGFLLRVTHARDKGEKLQNDKGVNFPDTELRLNPLTVKDLRDLTFIARHADMILYSFVQEAADIDLLRRELSTRLKQRKANSIAIIAKVETGKAIRNLPELIVHGAGNQPFGVLIARGDLAVEIGYERLVEMQEEILWLSEAAHVPVIWATQVLEGLAKKGRPTRAEMTDAAMSERAECVMLNKGPYVAEAVTILDDVLTRMQSHQLKKTPQLRALRSW